MQITKNIYRKSPKWTGTNYYILIIYLNYDKVHPVVPICRVIQISSDTSSRRDSIRKKIFKFTVHQLSLCRLLQHRLEVSTSHRVVRAWCLKDGDGHVLQRSTSFASAVLAAFRLLSLSFLVSQILILVVHI